MGSSWDDVWETVRDVLDTAARDFGSAASSLPARASHHLTEGLAEIGAAERSHGPDLTTTSFDLPGGTTTTARPSAYIPGRNLIEELDYSAVRWTRGTGPLGNSPVFEAIQRLQGFDGPVTSTSKQVVDAAIAAGRPQLFRGFEEDSHIDAFLTGPVRPGVGHTGSGTHATPLEDVAFNYTDPTRTQDLAIRRSRVLRMTLHPDAKIVTFSELEAQRNHHVSRIGRELEALRNIANLSDDERARRSALMDEELTFADIGQYGVTLGWDAIDGSSAFPDKEWAILNPTALLVQR